MRALVLLLLAVCGCEVGSRPTDGGEDAGSIIIVGDCEASGDDDGDGIYDNFEGDGDFEGDGIPNAADTDSDGDGYSDAEEHGIEAGCAARDLDRDTNPDFLDLDADGDGLSDEEERTRYFTDPTDEDSDDDGFTDLAEVATGHNPNDATDRIPEDTYYVVLPFEGDAVERDLVFGTTLRKADVFFMMDGTGSMAGERNRLVSSLATIVAQLTTTISDVGVGFGGFAGFGGEAGGDCTSIGGIMSCADGPEGDEPFRLDQVITTDLATMQAGAMRLHADYGGANWASSNEALYLAATGEGFTPWLGPQNCTSVPDEVGRRYGYPCFRPGALPIMVVLTDTSSKNGPMTSGSGVYDPSDFTMSARGPHTYAESLGALRNIGARVIGVISGDEIGSPSSYAQFRQWATDTGTVDSGGAPIQFSISSDGSGLDSSIVDAIRTLAEETPQDVSAAVRDGEDTPPEVGPVDAGLFIKAITPQSFFDGANSTPCPDATRCDDVRFYQVTPGGRVTFRIRFLNDFQMPRSHAQVFLAEILVLGNGVAELDSRPVVIVVPSGSVPILI
jgi:hypothetical protein